jgi:hypothetical protein
MQMVSRRVLFRRRLGVLRPPPQPARGQRQPTQALIVNERNVVHGRRIREAVWSMCGRRASRIILLVTTIRHEQFLRFANADAIGLHPVQSAAPSPQAAAAGRAARTPAGRFVDRPVLPAARRFEFFVAPSLRLRSLMTGMQ